MKVVVNPGGTNQSFVDEHIKQAQIIRVQNNVDNLQALRQKTADMMVTDLIEGDYYTEQRARRVLRCQRNAIRRHRQQQGVYDE